MILNDYTGKNWRARTGPLFWRACNGPVTGSEPVITRFWTRYGFSSRNGPVITGLQRHLLAIFYNIFYNIFFIKSKIFSKKIFFSSKINLWKCNKKCYMYSISPKWSIEQNPHIVSIIHFALTLTKHEIVMRANGIYIRGQRSVLSIWKAINSC